MLLSIYLVLFNSGISLTQSLAFSAFTAKLSLGNHKNWNKCLLTHQLRQLRLAASIRTLLPNCLLVTKPQEVLKTIHFKNSSSLQGFGHPLKATMMLQSLQTLKKFSIENNIEPDIGDLHLRASYPERRTSTKHFYALHVIFLRKG